MLLVESTEDEQASLLAEQGRPNAVESSASVISRRRILYLCLDEPFVGYITTLSVDQDVSINGIVLTEMVEWKYEYISILFLYYQYLNKLFLFYSDALRNTVIDCQVFDLNEVVFRRLKTLPN